MEKDILFEEIPLLLEHGVMTHLPFLALRMSSLVQTEAGLSKPNCVRATLVQAIALVRT
jgi:hypothetical protein